MFQGQKPDVPGLKTTHGNTLNRRVISKNSLEKFKIIQICIYIYIIIDILYTENKSKRTTTTLPSCQEHLLVRFERIYMKTHTSSKSSKGEKHPVESSRSNPGPSHFLGAKNPVLEGESLKNCHIGISPPPNG